MCCKPQPFNKMVQDMLRCPQNEHQSVYQHGLAVQHQTNEIVSYLRGHELKDFKIPPWLEKYNHHIEKNLYDNSIITLYTLYHDCGKPYCKVVDEQGKLHFPNHAEISKKTFFDLTKNKIVSNLIGWDMVIHTSSSEEIKHFCDHAWTIKDAVTLIVVALAEIHANAKMFGGTKSTSFKIKYKKVEKRGRQIYKYYFSN